MQTQSKAETPSQSPELCIATQTQQTKSPRKMNFAQENSEYEKTSPEAAQTILLTHRAVGSESG
jgi:hypothetical protein